VTGAEGGVALRYVGHATVLVEIDGVRILTDPFLRDRLGPLERHGPTPDADEIGRVDVILVSHGHPDHLDRRSLEAIEGNPAVVVPRRLGAVVQRWLGCEVVELRPGERREVRGIPIEAVRAKHWIAPGAPRAQPLGYLVGERSAVWFAGDTARYPEMVALRGRVDVALLPVWTWGPHLGPGHLGPEDAADVAGVVGARVAVPIHWGTLYPRRLHRLWTGPLVQPGDRFKAAAARRAPRTDVVVLRPGEGAHVRPTRSFPTR
jgi:L-ascorbate metabolism protein UlaG (beta-lactamase superfamily)